MTNLNTPAYEDRDADGFRARRARLARDAGAKKLGMSMWEVPPGEAAYPYHWHVIDEEVVVVLDEGLHLRGPDGTWRPVPQGEVIAFPVGEDGGHQLWNRGQSAARFLSISSGPADREDMVVYPDSGKLGAFWGTHGELYRREQAVGYWEGETPPRDDSG